MRDVAIVSFAESAPAASGVEETETQLLFPVINEALERVGISRRGVGFTCSATCDYLSGAPFAFVQTLEATGAWPPISESHVEMDGAWAFYEAWVRLIEGDVDVALAFAAGITSRANLAEVLAIQLDPYYVAPLWLDPLSLGLLQAQALVDAGKARAEDVLALEGPRYTDAAAAVVLAAGDRARELCARPAWIAGIDHRTEPHYLGVRDLTRSESARRAAEHAGVEKGGVDAAFLAAQFPHEEIVLREALSLERGVRVETAVHANPLIVTGLINVGRAAREIIEGRASRTVGHATSGPCLQQNLVCVLEA